MDKLFLWCSILLAAIVIAASGLAIATIDAKNIWNSLTAIGTLGAVLLTTLFSLDTLVRNRRRDLDSEQKQRQQLEQGQAEQVWWWTEECNEHASLFAEERWYGADPSLNECWGICLVIENRSEYPISEVRILSSEFLLPFMESTFFRSLGPSAKRVYHLVSEACSILSSPTHPGTRITFQDRHGQIWERQKSGPPAKRPESAREVEELSEAIEREQRQAIHWAHEHDWIDEVEAELRALLDSDSLTEQEDCLSEEQRSYFDAKMFKALQDLPQGFLRRRVAENWWKWRAGKLHHPIP